jgi:hypothetical protein
MTLHDVHPTNVLRIKNGSIVRSLYDLANELALMDEEVFRYHVNDAKNDFYEWVYHMVRDVHLAKVFSELKDRRLMLAAVEKRVRQLENPEQPAGQHPLHWGAREYLFGVIVGAIAMLMISRLL